MEKLLKVQSELKAPKNQFSQFGNYHYRSCEDILEAVKPLLKENGLVMSISDKAIACHDRVYIESTVTIFDIAGKEINKVSAVAREQATKSKFDESQLTGSASSYARKYALNGMFLIDDTKDADGQDNSEHKKTSEQVKDSKTEQVKETFKAKEVQSFDKNKAIEEIEKAMEIMKYDEGGKESIRYEYDKIESKGGFVELYKLVMGGK